MAYKIGEACINCGACVEACPAEAIFERDGKHWIDPDKCLSCGACSGACSTEAITDA
ncbi:MAG: 4Fe-4S binding protein [Treponema sp.]|jgi:ferredoxin|nr:4Fe-4S binding protein [Treponema sp.]